MSWQHGGPKRPRRLVSCNGYSRYDPLLNLGPVSLTWRIGPSTFHVDETHVKENKQTMSVSELCYISFLFCVVSLTFISYNNDNEGT